MPLANTGSGTADIPDHKWRDIWYRSQDGLKLYARHYSCGAESDLPVVCLPGLTRNSKDFHILASRLASARYHPHDVYCLDYRGRGQSQHDPNWENYSPYIETLDVLDFMTAMGLHGAAIAGTSRGGIIAMIAATMRPGVLRGVILNDIGPVVEPQGLARIIGYAGATPVPVNWDDATKIVKQINVRYFENMFRRDWLKMARQWFGEDEDGNPAPAYDPNLAKPLAEIDLSEEIPALWPQFGALEHIPTMVIRGVNSDILSEPTLKKMQAAKPDMEVYHVPGQGHAPLLWDEDSFKAIHAFLLRAARSHV